MAPGRIRVFIAGNIYVKRALVRRFLEDDGYEVVGEALTRQSLVATIRKAEPDAVVIDDELLAGGRGGTMARIRGAAPDAKIVVFTSSPTNEAAAPAGADGYLEKGVALSALTSLLVRLFADETTGVPPAPAGVAAGSERAAEPAAVGASGATRVAASTYGAAPGGPSSGSVARLVAIAGGAILIVWGLIAMIATGGITPVPVDTTDTTEDGTIIAAPNSLEDARVALGGLVDALESGNYVLATVQAQALVGERQQAIDEGFAVGGLDDAILVRLQGIVGALPQRVNTLLAEILGALYPTLPDEEEPGGGSGIILGPATGTGTFTGGGDTVGQDRDEGDDRDAGEDGDTGGSGDTVSLGPGDGREWGQSHKLDNVTRPQHGAAPGGGPPPWANGKAKGHDR